MEPFVGHDTVASDKKGYLMSNESRRLDRSLLSPLQGDESGSFDLKLLAVTRDALHDHVAGTQEYDDFAFQSHLRFLAAMYYFIGGKDFPGALSDKMEKSEETISRWLDGQSAPVPTVRESALRDAEALILDIEVLRQSGASLWDISSKHTK